MKRHSSFTFLLLILLSTASTVLSQEKTDSYRHFTGYVKDEDNKPVAETTVCGWDKSDRPMSGRIPCTDSAQDGSFSLRIKKWEGDRYYIFVYDYEKGYPNPNSALYENSFRDKQTVDVDAKDESKPIEIKLGMKAGKAILKIVYDESGKPVESGQVKMCRIDNPEICQSVATTFRKGVIEILTPNSPVTLKIELHDGTSWRGWLALDESNSVIQTMQVESGQKKEFKIRIRQ